MIQIHGLEKYFGTLQVLKGIDLEIPKGEVLSIIGASGSGKSTLLYCINGLEPIQSGTVNVAGTDVHAKGTDINKLRQKMGMVFLAMEQLSTSNCLGKRGAGPQDRHREIQRRSP